jgi:hypothetical protein
MNSTLPRTNFGPPALMIAWFSVDAWGRICGPGAFTPATYKHLQKLGAEVSLASLKQLIAHDFTTFGHSDHITV